MVGWAWLERRQERGFLGNGNVLYLDLGNNTDKHICLILASLSLEHFTYINDTLKNWRMEERTIGMAGQRQRAIKWNNTLVLGQSLCSKRLELHREGVRMKWPQDKLQWLKPSLRCLSNIVDKFVLQSHLGSPDSSTSKGLACNAGDTGDARSLPESSQEDSTGGWKGKPTPVLLPEKSHGQRSQESYTPKGCKESDMTEQLSTTPFILIPNSSVMCIPNGLGVIVFQKSSTLGHLGRLSGAYFTTGHWARPSYFFPQESKLGSACPYSEASQENLKVIAIKGWKKKMKQSFVPKHKWKLTKFKSINV